MNAETHYIQRSPWLRAAVLGANDGIISTASIILGFITAGADAHTILLSGLAGLVAGAASMASGEYVSVSSQLDLEKADLRRESAELARDFESETKELTNIYISRGLTRDLAQQVSAQLMQKDPLKAHAREELGISELTQAKPLQAALASALSFSIGAALPMMIVWVCSRDVLAYALIGLCVAFLAGLGFLSAKVGGANSWRAALRVGLWGTLAMAVTSGVGFISASI